MGSLCGKLVCIRLCCVMIAASLVPDIDTMLLLQLVQLCRLSVDLILSGSFLALLRWLTLATVFCCIHHEFISCHVRSVVV